MHLIKIVTILSLHYFSGSDQSPTIIEAFNDLGGVQECHFCEGGCKEIKTQKCVELDKLEGFPVKSACLTFKMTNTDNITTTTRGCVRDDDSVQSGCNTINIANFGTVSCNICKSDLCNFRASDTGVQQCYVCDGTCEDEPQIEDCPAKLGETVVAKCLSSITKDGQISKRCTAHNILDQIRCNIVNSNGGTCTTCETDLCNEDTPEITTKSTTSVKTTTTPQTTTTTPQSTTTTPKSTTTTPQSTTTTPKSTTTTPQSTTTTPKSTTTTPQSTTTTPKSTTTPAPGSANTANSFISLIFVLIAIVSLLN